MQKKNWIMKIKEVGKNKHRLINGEQFWVINWSQSSWCQFLLLPLQLSISDLIPLALIAIHMLMNINSLVPKLQTFSRSLLGCVTSASCSTGSNLKKSSPYFSLPPQVYFSCFPIGEDCNLTHLVSYFRNLNIIPDVSSFTPVSNQSARLFILSLSYFPHVFFSVSFC